MRLLKLFAAFIFVTGTAFCQTNWPPPMILAAPPAGGCPNGIFAVDIVTNNLYFCAGGSWHLANGGGGPAPRLDQILDPTGDWTPTIGAHNVTITGTGLWSFGAMPVNSTSGYRIAGAAASGNYLRGDGTNFVSSAIQLADTPAASRIRACTIIVGDPGAASAVLADDNDSPVACSNSWTTDWTITGAACWADAGSPTVTPILTAGAATSVLTGALTCGTAAWAPGTINGTPVVKPFNANGSTCAATPCTIDANITTAGGVAKYLIIKIIGTL